MRVSRARISGSMLSRLGARWVTMTKAMPGSGGMALNKYSSASTPPAEAPTPTIGNGLSIGSPGREQERGGVYLPRVARGRRYAMRLTNTKRLNRARDAWMVRCTTYDVAIDALCARGGFTPGYLPASRPSAACETP